MSYGFGTKTSLPYAEAVEAAKAALKEQGFGVLSEIDVRATPKEKRGIDFLVEALDPERALEVAGNERLRPIAAEAKIRLRSAIDSLSAGR